MTSAWALAVLNWRPLSGFRSTGPSAVEVDVNKRPSGNLFIVSEIYRSS